MSLRVDYWDGLGSTGGVWVMPPDAARPIGPIVVCGDDVPVLDAMMTTRAGGSAPSTPRLIGLRTDGEQSHGGGSATVDERTTYRATTAAAGSSSAGGGQSNKALLLGAVVVALLLVGGKKR